MKRSCSSLLLAFVLLAPVVGAQTPTSRSDPAPAHPSLQRKSIVDSFGLINSRNTDYGQCIEDARRIGIESTVDSVSFWSNVVALVTAFGFLVYILQLRKQRTQMLWSTAQLVAKYQNQLSAGQQSYQHLHKEYSQFLEELEQQKEPKLTLKSSAARGRNPGENRDNGPAVAVQPEPRVADQRQGLNQSPMRDDTVASLRQQVSSLTHQLEQERQKNRRLRGE